MPRPKSKPAAAPATIDTEALTHAAQAADQHHAMVATVDAQYALGTPYNYEASIAQIQFAVTSTGQQLLEMGRHLVLIREHEPRDRFEDALVRTGLSRRFALKTMQAAVKFTGNDAKQLVGARLGSAKLLELVSEDDDDLAALGDGGTVAGVTLDEIERMSVRQLKATLRAERAEREEEKTTLEELLEKKNKKVDDLTRKAKRWDRSPVRDRAEELLRGVDEEAVSVIAAVKRLEDSMNALVAVYAENGEAVEADIEGRMEQAARTLIDRAAELGQIAGL